MTDAPGRRRPIQSHKYGNMGRVKTTIELPDPVLRQARVLAAARGTTLKRLFTEALEEKIRAETSEAGDPGSRRPWMAGFGELSHLSEETRRIQRIIDDEFGRLEPEDLE